MPLIIFTGQGVDASVDVRPFTLYEWLCQKEEQGVDLIDYMLQKKLKFLPLEPGKILPNEPEKHSDLYRIYGTLKILNK
jgi:hypothetical protein